MKLEDQVVSLELAKRLKELGVKQGGAWFCWDEDAMGDAAVYRQSDTNPGLAAFTVAELGEMLPASAWSDNKEGIGTLEIMKSDEDGQDCWVTNYASRADLITAPTMADSMAKMLIFLIEKGVVKP